MSNTYRPLPECLTIKDSSIEGLGLFATKVIEKDEMIGVSHIESQELGLIRTTIGGFYNHSDKPNCIKHKVANSYVLVPIRKIDPGEEITVKYTLYDVPKESLEMKVQDDLSPLTDIKVRVTGDHVNSVASALRHARESNCMTGHELANICGINFFRLHGFEVGEVVPTENEAKKLGMVFNTDYEKFLTKE